MSSLLDTTTFETIVSRPPYNGRVEVAFIRKSGSAKLFAVNSTLRFVQVLEPDTVQFVEVTGQQTNRLVLHPEVRRLWDREGHQFIIGYGMKPLLVFTLSGTKYELFFNGHIFVDVATSYKEWYPSATIVVHSCSPEATLVTRSPLSRGSDIRWTGFDPRGALVIETTLGYLNVRLRKHFRGFKHIDSSHKYLISAGRIDSSIKKIAHNNRVTCFEDVDSVEEFDVVAAGIAREYFPPFGRRKG